MTPTPSAGRDHKHDPRLERLLGPAGREVTCDRCFELLDEYVELERAGAEAEVRLPAVRTHLEGCRACGEEHETLRALLAEDQRG